MNKAFLDCFRCPETYATFNLVGELSGAAGYFRFGPDAICYGESIFGACAPEVTCPLKDVSSEVRIEQSRCFLPFHPSQVVDNLRYERYVEAIHRHRWRSNFGRLVRTAYYAVGPRLRVPIRRRLQRIALRGWQEIVFPSWPVDCTVERILEKLCVLSLKTHGVSRIPFIWFWPEEYSSCVIVTHDVETAAGLASCPSLMDLNESFGIKGSFQLIPEGRYRATERTLQTILERGFEINVHDLNHNGRLFEGEEEFRRQAKRINGYARDFGALGFRSGALYRNLEWYDAFSFSYDMSVPNVAHLDAQRGGCCTIMPYFVGNILEIPVTTTQDYSLFHILGEYSLELWQQQIDLIKSKNGLISFIIHPDYIIEERARAVYRGLLRHLSQLRSEGNLWITLPREVDRWWRQRSQMKLTCENGAWRIEGSGKERARIAYAWLNGDEVLYSLET